MKRKRKLKSFRVICRHNNDDFIMARKTIVIHYTLAGQSKRRYFMFSFPEFCLNHTKSLSQYIYEQFKTSLNIKHT